MTSMSSDGPPPAAWTSTATSGRSNDGDETRPSGTGPLATPAHVTGLAALVTVTVTVATGLWLLWAYTPATVAGWNDIGSLESDVALGLIVRDVHRAATVLSAVLVIGWIGLLAAVGSGRRWLLPCLVLALLAVAVFTGRLIEFDQLALFSLTTGEGIAGYWPILLGDDDITFVLVDGRTVDLATMRTLTVVHLAAELLAAGVVVAAALRPRSGQPSAGGYG